LTLADFNDAQQEFVPLSLRDVKLQKSEVEWGDVGGLSLIIYSRAFRLKRVCDTGKPYLGLHNTRRILRETLEWPTKYGAIFASCPLRLRSGSVFLYIVGRRRPCLTII
jgi:peroxin-1